ncbi:type II toxin-antitoxin system RelE/ParE family toxin [Acidipila sp. EB88]|uniref:type II toxin-antitoxin system RelE/ParE family toxin n=1 Tax=Acidipila sp. EB88 TaxID=2305226 RepID=UPI000F5EA78D|nr:type II toxin-antitoxin system RelE/ParE family toxin [Acidipila sp. EB88]RRA48435.1 type II toxin-antitoxin system RelE/ParE family toxin [Acidipila sp. EB88]
MVELLEYVDVRGRSAFGRWYSALEPAVRARIAVALDRLSRNALPAKGVGEGVQELRLAFGPGYRVYFARDGGALVILLAGGTKRRQSADIERAQALWREYRQRKGE